MSTELEKREFIVKKFLENPRWTFKKIAREVNVTEKTVSSAIKRYQESFNLQRKHGSGRKKGFHNAKKAKEIVAKLQQNPNLSNRKLADKVKTSEATVRRVKKSVGMKTYKVQKIPDRNAEKNLEAKNRARKLKCEFFQENECCIMDDETYVLADFSQLPGQEFYSAVGRGSIDKKFRTKNKSKFPKKFLVWQAICSCGFRSQSFIAPGTINSEIYVKECLQKRLLPFIRKHTGSNFFWPDLASCHYGKLATKWYEDNNVNFVPRDSNPPNSPELRPVERYWALCKKQLKERRKYAKTIEVFKRSWKTASEKVSKDTIQRLMAGIPKKITQFCQKDF
jgi:transposase